MQKTNSSRYLREGVLISILSSVVFVSGCVRYAIPRSENWSETIEANKNPVTGSTVIRDPSSFISLFTYDEAPSAQPVVIKKIDDDHWIVIMERPGNSTQPNFEVKPINDDEYSVKITHR